MDIYSWMLPQMKWTDQGCLKNSFQLTQTLDFFLSELPFLRAFTLGNMLFLCPFEICTCVCVCVLSHVQLCDPIDCSPPGSSLSMGVSRQEYLEGVVYYSFLHEICWTQGSNPCLLHLLHWQVDSLPWHHLRSLIKRWGHGTFINIFYHWFCFFSIHLLQLFASSLSCKTGLPW